MEYIDVTEIYSDKKYYRIKKQKYYIDDFGNKYNVDGKHVILKPTKREIEVAKILGRIYGGKVIIIPRVNEPPSMKTPDYIINERNFDLKEIKGNGKYVIQGNLKGKQEQANNFVIDISKSKLSKEEAINQLQNIYKSKHYLWLEEVILIKGKDILIIYRRK